MLAAIQQLYKKVEFKVKVGGHLSGAFPASSGVRQGCPLSPLLFGLYVDPLENYLKSTVPDAGPALMVPSQPYRIPVLMYADDITLASERAQDLQLQLDALNVFCSERGLAVNQVKTKIMVFHRRPKSRAAEAALLSAAACTYEGHSIEVVDTFKYLGSQLDSRGCTPPPAQTGRAAAINMWRRCKAIMMGSDIDIQTRLFDGLVTPVLSYGCEIWTATRTAPTEFRTNGAELVHKDFLRRTLRLQPSVSDHVLYSEFNRRPLYSHWWRMVLKYYNKLSCLSQGDVLKRVLVENTALGINTIDNWGSRVRKFVLDLDNNAWGATIVPTKLDVDGLLALLHEKQDHHWDTYGDSRLCPEGVGRKVCTYASWFRDENARRPPYLSVKCNFKKLVNCARFRTGCHKLRIETGCRLRESRSSRTCVRCALGAVDDECHAVFDCTKFEALRFEFEDLFMHAAGSLRKIWSFSDPHRVVEYFHALTSQLTAADPIAASHANTSPTPGRS